MKSNTTRYLKHAVLQERTSSTIRSGGRRRQVFQVLCGRQAGIAIPKTVLLPQKDYPIDVDITAESLHNLEYPMDWDGLPLRRPAAILKPFSGGVLKHVYKVNNKEELLARTTRLRLIA